MPANQKLFEQVEKQVRDQGKLNKLEQTGKITGHMMITEELPPADMKISVPEGFASFVGTFDFFDYKVGIVVNPKTREAAGSIWLTCQKPGGQRPNHEWIGFFLQTLSDCFQKDGTYSMPVCTWITDADDYSYIPDQKAQA